VARLTGVAYVDELAPLVVENAVAPVGVVKMGVRADERSGLAGRFNGKKNFDPKKPRSICSPAPDPPSVLSG
jgi:hypothetical protein